MSPQQMESPIEAIVEYMKTFVEQLVANEDSIDVMITECLQSMIASVDHKCHELSDESTDGIKSGDNLGVDDIDMSEDFWDELDDDFDINFSDNDMKSSPRELTTTSDEKRLDFNQKFSLLLSELVAKPSTDTSRVDVSVMATRLVSQLDSINDAILGLIHRLRQMSDPMKK